MIFAFCVWPLVLYVFGCGQCHPYSLHSQVSFGGTENERIYFYRANKMKIIYYCMQSHLSAWQRRWTASAVARLLIANSQSANPATFPACKSEETTVIITIVTWMCAAFEIVGKQLIIRFFFSSFEAVLCSTLITYVTYGLWWMKFSTSIAVGYVRPPARQREIESFGRVSVLVIGSMVNYICYVICLTLQSNPFYFESIRFYSRRGCERARSHTNFIPLPILNPFTCK